MPDDLFYKNNGSWTAFLDSILGGDSRDRAQRAFYNSTRAGLWNPATAPEYGNTYGGLGLGLADRRTLDMGEAQSIADQIRSRQIVKALMGGN